MTPRPPRCLLLVLIATVVGVRAQEPLPDAQSFISESLKHLRSNDLLLNRYTFQEKETRYSHGPDGKLVRTQVRIYEVTGSPDPDLAYHRLVSVDGIVPDDLARRDAEQQRKEQDWLARQRRQGLDEREALLRKQEIEDHKEQAVVAELPSIFEFRMTGRQTIDGRPAIVLAFEPRPKYSPRSAQGRLVKNFSGEAWVDEQDHELVRLKAEALENISVKFGFLVRLLKGSRGLIERRKLNGETWLPTYSRFTATGKLLLVREIDVDLESEYSAYRKLDSYR